VDKPTDFESTTAVLARRAPGLAWLPTFLRQRLTPAALWSAIAALVTALAISITWLVNTQSNIHQLKESVADLQRERDLLHRIDTQIAVMASKVDGIATEVERQRAWRDKIEGVAEAPPHARRK
jgi:hypothetical protein